MAANSDPIFSKLSDIQYSQAILLAAADYTGLNVNNALVFKADATNGGYIQRLRCKALGTNVASVLRIYLNPGVAHLASLTTLSGITPTATPSASGGTVLTASYYAKVVPVDATGALGTVSTESAAVAVTGPTGSIPWTWTAAPGAVSYRIYVGTATGAQTGYFTSATNSYSQTQMVEQGGTDGIVTTTNNVFYGELSLPAITASSSVATPDVDYPMNFALPPGWELYVGLGTAVAAGWQVSAIGGKY